ncbi:MAG: ABC transporter ATP-binding protein [Calditrichaeota bacterium]|nr:MAG: ABC transporter ATP-binding protein [Calditrichota bacterium]
MIEIKKVSKSFDEQPVLNGVELIIEDGSSHVIIGRSGCGKSVLLKHIVGLLKPDEGDIWVDNVSVVSMRRRELYKTRVKIGMLFQGSALFDSMNVEENISLGVREHRMFPHDEISDRVAAKLELVDLHGIQKKFPSELSGGMKKRVSLARALMMEPKYMLYDEPTTGLDPVMADAINDLIISVRDRLGVTSIVVTHDMASAYKVGDHISMLHEGLVNFSGTPDEIRKSKNRVVQNFITGNQVVVA